MPSAAKMAEGVVPSEIWHKQFKSQIHQYRQMRSCYSDFRHAELKYWERLEHSVGCFESTVFEYYYFIRHTGF